MPSFAPISPTAKVLAARAISMSLFTSLFWLIPPLLPIQTDRPP